MAALHANPTGPQGVTPGVDFAAAFQMAPVGLAVLDHDLKYVHCNDFLAEINGFPVEYHIGRRFSDLLPQLAAILGPVYHEVFKTGEPVRDFEVHGPTPGATIADRTWLASAAPMEDHTGRVLHILVSVKEITEFAQTRAAVRQSEENFRIAQQLSTNGFSIFKAIRDEAGEIVDFLWEYPIRQPMRWGAPVR